MTINPMVDPVFTLDLVLIEPSRRAMSPAARTFLEMLQEETERLEEPWAAYLTARKEAGARSAYRLRPDIRQRENSRRHVSGCMAMRQKTRVPGAVSRLTLHYRNDFNPARISSIKSSGCSQAAKWPPLSSLL